MSIIALLSFFLLCVAFVIDVVIFAVSVVDEA